MKYLALLFILLLAAACNAQPTKKPKGYKLDIVPVLSNTNVTYTITDSINACLYEKGMYYNAADPFLSKMPLSNFFFPYIRLNQMGIPELAVGSIIGYAAKKYLGKLDTIFNSLCKNSDPRLSDYRLLASYSPLPKNEFDADLYSLYLCFVGDESSINGSHIKDIKKSKRDDGVYEIELEMTLEGSILFDSLTAQCASKTPQGGLAIIVNNKVISCPTVTGTIKDGKASISGNFSSKEIDEIIEMVSVH